MSTPQQRASAYPSLRDKIAWPIGTPIYVVRDNGAVLKSKTRSEPALLGGHTWVVWVEGIVGCYDLARCSRREIES
jgi:hypothetical protein